MRTKAGTWCVDEAERDYIEEAVDKREKWNELLKEKKEWLNPPTVVGQKPGASQEELMLPGFLETIKQLNVQDAKWQKDQAKKTQGGPESMEKDLPGDANVSC